MPAPPNAPAPAPIPIARPELFQQGGSPGSFNALQRNMTKPPIAAAPTIAPIIAPFPTESRRSRMDGCSAANASATALSEMTRRGGAAVELFCCADAAIGEKIRQNTVIRVQVRIPRNVQARCRSAHCTEIPALKVIIWVRRAAGSTAVAPREPSLTNRTSKPAPRRGFMNHRAPPPKLSAWFQLSGKPTSGMVLVASALALILVVPTPALR